MIKELFEAVLGQYKTMYATKTRDEKIERILLNGLKDTLTRLAVISEDEYRVYGTIGSGGLPEVPWLAICDKEVTTSTKEGYYLVYLFDAEMKGIYLSLVLGYTQFEVRAKERGQKNYKKIARDELQEQTRNIFRSLDSIPKDFVGGDINLHATQDLGRGYEVGQIFSKFYPAKTLVSDQELLKDFQFALSAYRELKKKIGLNYMKPINIGIAPIASDVDPEIEMKIPEDIPITELDLDIPKPPNTRKYNKAGWSQFDKDEDEQNRKEWKKIGDRAEEIVEYAEKKRLRAIGRQDLADDVEIVSKNTSLGYDVLSFEDDGREKHIEVKGSRNSVFNFHLTHNEIAASLSPSNNYYFYHVHHVFGKSTIGFVRHPNFDSPQFIKKAAQYRVTYKVKKKK
jgi:hypothetical protein